MAAELRNRHMARIRASPLASETIAPWRFDVSKRIHIAAAAKQLNRKLFNDLPIEGGVLVGNDNLEVQVHGIWPNAKLDRFAGYSVAWREVRTA
jgi:hypothetical protein